MSTGTRSGQDGSSRSAATRADIDATRARMGDTLEELGARLNPERLKQQAKDKVRDATIGRVQTMANTTVDKATTAGRKVTDAVRENPIPAGLIAAGISWFVFNARRSGSSPSITGSRYPSRQASRPPVEDDTTSNFEEPGDSGIGDKVRDKAGQVADSTQGIAQRAKETVADVASNVTRTAQVQSENVTTTFQQNPLPVGFVAVALGLAAGFAFPSTRKEGELVGEKRDELLDKARDVVREKKEKAQNVAKRVVREAKATATQAAREEGLTSAP